MTGETAWLCLLTSNIGIISTFWLKRFIVIHQVAESPCDSRQGSKLGLSFLTARRTGRPERDSKEEEKNEEEEKGGARRH